MIQFDDVRFQYSRDGFSLHFAELRVEDEERLAIVGPSGCGKTTLLHLIAGIRIPDSGQILVDDIEVSKLSDTARRQFRVSSIGLVFQEFELLDYLNVLENILLPYRINPALAWHTDTRDRAAAMAKSVGLEGKLYRSIHRLSQGERQRVAICRALVTGPRYILADEPTGNLDPSLKSHILDILFANVSDRSATLVMVTHDHSLLTRFQRVIALDEMRDQDYAIEGELMLGIIWLAGRYVAFHRGRSALLVSCLTIISYLPLAVGWLTGTFQEELVDRASSTPLLVGKKGSRFDLTLNALYFEGKSIDPLPAKEWDRMEETGLARAIPLSIKHRTRSCADRGDDARLLRFSAIADRSGNDARSIGGLRSRFDGGAAPGAQARGWASVRSGQCL